MKLQHELISRNFYVIFAGYPLRPELIESAMYLYKATRDPFLLSLGEDMLDSIEYSAKTPCGYATVKDVRDHTLEDRMESFFLSETTKYMYLLFDVDNEIIHKHKEHVVKTPFGECVVESGGWIFNTEAHPIGTYKKIREIATKMNYFFTKFLQFIHFQMPRLFNVVLVTPKKILKNIYLLICWTFSIQKNSKNSRVI